MLLAKQHYHTEADLEPETVPAAAAAGEGEGVERGERRGRGRLADWCIGEPLLQRGWDLSGLLAVAEREDGRQTTEEEVSSSEMSSRDAVVVKEELVSSEDTTQSTHLTASLSELAVPLTGNTEDMSAQNTGA